MTKQMKTLELHYAMMQLLILGIFIWQGSLEVNPSILTGSFLCRDVAMRSVSMATVISRLFVFFVLVFESSSARQ